eukprot:6214054-Pleurochrysis_carterae.AAC.3
MSKTCAAACANRLQQKAELVRLDEKAPVVSVGWQHPKDILARRQATHAGVSFRNVRGHFEPGPCACRRNNEVSPASRPSHLALKAAQSAQTVVEYMHLRKYDRR